MCPFHLISSLPPLLPTHKPHSCGEYQLSLATAPCTDIRRKLHSHRAPQGPSAQPCASRPRARATTTFPKYASNVCKSHPASLCPHSGDAGRIKLSSVLMTVHIHKHVFMRTVGEVRKYIHNSMHMRGCE
jgi:hypothetical protein